MDAIGELLAAVKAGDAARVAATLQRYPELKGKLDHPIYHFDAPVLHGAAERQNREMVDVLLRAGADINARSQWWAGGFGVLDYAPLAMVPFLMERGAVVDVHSAARLGLIEKLAELLSADPGLVRARGGDGQTPLHFASTVEVARYLVGRGAELDARDIDHESTPAQYMVRDRQQVARYLVSCGCRTDLLMAAALGDLALVRKHLDAEPASVRLSVSPADFPKQNPRAGGTIYIWTLGWHKTAHLVAREFGHEEVFRLLMERSPAELKLAMACELGEREAVEALLANHPGLVQTLGEDDRRRLVNAAWNNNTEAVRLMLAAGWPVDARGPHNATALHWAAWHGNAAMVREILRYAPPVDARGDEYDLPPLRWALHGSLHGWHAATGDYAGVVEALLQAGAALPPITPDLQASDAVREVLRKRC